MKKKRFQEEEREEEKQSVDLTDKVGTDGSGFVRRTRSLLEDNQDNIVPEMTLSFDLLWIVWCKGEHR